MIDHFLAIVELGGVSLTLPRLHARFNIGQARNLKITSAADLDFIEFIVQCRHVHK